jgi:hypothetical protein
VAEVPAKRRRGMDRSPINRLEMWNRKMDPSIYATYLEKTKPLALPKVASYQITHEYIISTVKSALQSYPSEIPIMQEYMWYAEKMWKISQKYKSTALQNEADALFLYYLARGRLENALRTIALAFNIKISSSDIIFERIGVPSLLSIIGKGTVLTDGTEQTILTYVGTAIIQGYIDLSNMQSGDEVTIRVYVKIKETGDFVLYAPETYRDEQPAPAIYMTPKLSGYAFKVTIQQTQGTYKNFDYLFTKSLT